MLRFLKKRLKSSPKPVLPNNPTQQTTETDAERDRDFGGPDASHGGIGSRVVNQEAGIENQQLPVPSAPTSTPINTGGNSTPRARSVQRPSGVTRERTPGGNLGGEDSRGLVQPRVSRVKERGPVTRALRRASFALDLAKGASEAFCPLRAVLESISIVYTKYQNADAVKDKIEILCSRIAALGKLFGQPTNDEREIKRREGLLITLKLIEGKLRSLGGKSATLRYLDEVQDSEDVCALLEDLQEAVNDYMLVQQMAIYNHGCDLMDGAEKSVLNNFRYSTGAQYRHGERKGCLKGTRGDVLNGIEVWTRDFSRLPVYWLNGLAGTGKSTIAKTIAERLFVDDRLGASFFCSRDFENRRNLHLIFPSLATQLARKYPKFRSILVPLIQSDPEIAYESLCNQMEKLIVRPLNESGISTVIVIDALDECEDEEPASAILSVLGRLVSKIPEVKFFVTGRPESRISEGFRLPLLAKMTDVFVLHEVEPYQVDSDIRLFYKTSFLGVAGRRRGLDNWPTEEQMDRLCERAAGLFVYAAATAKFISDNKRNPRERLDLLLRSQKIGAREGKTLDLLYTSILQEAFGDDLEDDPKTRSVLGAVVLAANPLSPSAIAALLGFDPEDVPPLLSSVSSLLILREDTNRSVRPFHKSFPDFVTDPVRCADERFHISPPDHHLELLIGCLNLMNQTLERDMCKLPDAVANSDINDLKEKTEKYIDPALRYACLSWHTHLSDADATPADEPTITPILQQFLETKFLFWLEVLSVLGAVRNAVDALQVTADWLEEPPTLGLTNDCFSFVTGYFEIISASVPHIYHSALVLAPKESIVRELYGSYACPSVRIVHGERVSWGTSTVATTRPSRIELAVWSPCNRFIAIGWFRGTTVDVLDPVTLQRLQALEFPQGTSTWLRALVFSPDSRILTCSSCDDMCPEIFVVSWDLQTGGIVSSIRHQGPMSDVVGFPSITYSADAKMVGIYYRWSCGDITTSTIFIFDVASGTHIRSHPLNGDNQLLDGIWTQGECLRFMYNDTTTIAIWEVTFTGTPGAPPTEVGRLSVPPMHNGRCADHVQFIPTPCRLVLTSGDGVLVWDPQNAKQLLHCTDEGFLPMMTFSSSGRFFACTTRGSDIYLWKESPTGYILHEIIGTGTIYSKPLLSPNGESITAFGLDSCTIRLWRTRRLTTPPSSVSTRVPRHTDNFILSFSPDGVLAVIARHGDNAVVVLDLESGAPQLTIDAGTEVYGLQVVGDTVVVVGNLKVIAWNLPAGDYVPGIGVGLEGSTWTINLDNPDGDDGIISVSISPDHRHVALTVQSPSGPLMYFYSASTGERLAPTDEIGYGTRSSPHWREIWCVGGSGEVYGAGGAWDGRRFGVEHPPKGFPWGSVCGYRVTDDWWVLGPDGKRLLMLPPRWQSYAVRRVWKEQFLVLLHGGLLEPVILDLDP